MERRRGRREKTRGTRGKEEEDDDWEGESEGDVFLKKRRRGVDVFETTCSLRHDSDKMTSLET